MTFDLVALFACGEEGGTEISSSQSMEHESMEHEHEVVVRAPMGALGMMIGNRTVEGREGVFVFSLFPTSPLLGLVVEGDRLVSISDAQLTGMDASVVTTLLKLSSESERTLVLIRRGGRGGGEEDYVDEWRIERSDDNDNDNDSKETRESASMSMGSI